MKSVFLWVLTAALVASIPIHASIDKIIEAAAPGSIVVVGPGIYDEVVVVNKPIRIIFRDAVVRGIVVEADAYIMGAVVEGEGSVGIKVSGVRATLSDVRVRGFNVGVEVVSSVLLASNVAVEGSKEGIRLSYSPASRLVMVTVRNCEEVGVVVLHSSNVSLLNSYISGCKTGAEFYESPQARVLGNRIQDCGTGISVKSSPGTNVIANIISGCDTGIYFSGSWGGYVTGNVFMGCGRSVVRA